MPSSSRASANSRPLPSARPVLKLEPNTPSPTTQLGLSGSRSTAAEWHTSDASSSSSSPASASSPLLLESPASDASSPPSSRASSPSSSSSACGSPKPKKKSVSRRVAKDPNHIPRPKNSFILFRSDKCRELRDLEHDHRMISKIIGKMWSEVSPEEKAHYEALAAEEKALHQLKYPNYRFSPQTRANPPKRRNVKRNGESDKQRCSFLADLLLKGKGGEDLKAEVEKFDLSAQEKELARQSSAGPSDDYTTAVFHANGSSQPWGPPTPQLSFSPSSCSDSSLSSETPFRSPLLPPTTPSSHPDLQIEIEPSTPLSPLQFAPQPQLHTPALNVFANNDALLEQPPAYALSFGAMQGHEQDSLALSNMFAPAHGHAQQDFGFAPELYVHGIIHGQIDATLHATYHISAGTADYQPTAGYQLQPQPQSQSQPEQQQQQQQQQVAFTNPFPYAQETFGAPAQTQTQAAQGQDFWAYAPAPAAAGGPYGEYVPCHWPHEADGLEGGVQGAYTPMDVSF